MGKFSEMDILIQESYERGFKEGFKEAGDKAFEILEDLQKERTPVKIEIK